MGKDLYSDARERLRSMLKAARIESGLSQQELAEKLGRPQSYVSDYERGHRRLDWVAVTEVLSACGADIVEFAKSYAEATAKPSAARVARKGDGKRH